MVIEYLATTTKHIEIVENMWDKSNHFLAFMTLYLFLRLGFQQIQNQCAVVLLFAFGIQIELVQSFIPGRFFSLWDVVADMIGVFIGIGVYKIIEKKLQPL